MKYTKYLSALASAQGVPNMNNAQFKTLMNIVHLEGRLTELEALKKKAINSHEPPQYDIYLNTQKEKIRTITNNDEPKVFFQRLMT